MGDKVCFRGMVQGLGVVERVELLEGADASGSSWPVYDRESAAAKLWIRASSLPGVRAGENLSVNGVCLTVREVEGEMLLFHLWPATVERTNLLDLARGQRVNLERSRDRI
ncbi:MAG: hypothetical protein QHH02_04745 [Syntrophomonadaceae bacterium]|nr:hypothetical protein [Syntrophomonadaceae bacterium]